MTDFFGRLEWSNYAKNLGYLLGFFLGNFRYVSEFLGVLIFLGKKSFGLF